MSPGERMVSSEIGAPLTVVPLALPRSFTVTSRPLTTSSAWRRLTESSSMTMSTPATRPTVMVPVSVNVFPVMPPVNPRSWGPAAFCGPGRLASAPPAEAPLPFMAGTTRVERGGGGTLTALPLAAVGSREGLASALFALGSGLEPSLSWIS